MYEYNATVENIVDGDTVDVDLDLGFDVSLTRRLRLEDVDTAEIHFVSRDSEEYSTGMRHYEFVQEWVETAQSEFDGEYPFVVETEKHDRGKYGRYLADITRKCDGGSLSDTLIETFGEEVVY